jgi:hypothetical protein
VLKSSVLIFRFLNTTRTILILLYFVMVLHLMRVSCLSLHANHDWAGLVNILLSLTDWLINCFLDHRRGFVDCFTDVFEHIAYT